MPHRDALVAARERIDALERELEDARALSGASTSEIVDRLVEEKRALQAERARLVIERDRLIDDLARAKAALAKAEETSAAVRRELGDALAIRDQLRRQAIDEAARAAASRRAQRASELPPPERLAAIAALDVHNLAKGAIPIPAGKLAGVLCPGCLARGENVEMAAVGPTAMIGGSALAQVACPRCGSAGMKRVE